MTSPGYPPPSSDLPPHDGAAVPPGAYAPAYESGAGTKQVEHTRTSAAWAGLVLGGLVLILLLVFILQNGGTSAFHFLGFDFSLPRGIALLLAALAGAAIMAFVGGIRIFQLRRAYRRASR